MGEHAIAFALVIAAWWIGTGLLILCCAQSRTVSVAGAAVIAALFGVSLAGISFTAEAVTTLSVYGAFVSALSLWAGVEYTFLAGLITGPHRDPCPEDAGAWQRFRLAVMALLYHEVLILVCAAAVIALAWGSENQIGVLTFLILAVMRISAKLNIFAGVPYFTDSYMPVKLSYLKTYYRRRNVGLLFLTTMTGAIVTTGIVGRAAYLAEGPLAIGFSLLATLLALAIIEHLFMIMPFSDAVFWRWAQRQTGKPPAQSAKTPALPV